MLEKIERALKEYDMLQDCSKVIVGLSGGADSVSLLYSLKALSKKLGIEISACHINHNLRGKESDSDEVFVVELCKRLEIELNVFSVDIKAEKVKHESTEECARRLRYSVFGELAEKENAKLATAHNANDNAETILLNITRGTGLKGLCGIPVVREYLIRPLIYCTRAEVEKFCIQNSLNFCTDKTNFSTDFTRNKIRIEVIPKLIEINPSLIDGIVRMKSHLDEDSGYLEDSAQKAKIEATVIEKSYDTAKLRLLPKPILRRVIISVLKESGVEQSNTRIEGIEAIILEEKGKINIEKNKFAVVKNGGFSICDILQNYRK